MNAHVQAFVAAAIQAAAEVYGIPTEDIAGDRGQAEESWARQVAMYVTIEFGRIPSTDAAPYFDRNPSTLRHARILVDERVRIYPEDRDKVSKVARLALDCAPQAARPSRQIMSPDDAAFVGYLTAVLTNPKHASEAAELRMGHRCITYGPCGALALHPFEGKP